MQCSPHLHPQPSSCSFTASVLSVVPQGYRFGGTPQTSTEHSCHRRRLQTPCSRCRLPACCCLCSSTCMWCYLVRQPAHIRPTARDVNRAHLHVCGQYHLACGRHLSHPVLQLSLRAAWCRMHDMHSKRQLLACVSLHDEHQWAATLHHHCGMTTKLLFRMHCSMGPVLSH